MNSNFFKNRIVRAGAGAGKTTNLTTTLAKLAHDHKASSQKWPRFVVTTFTRKATQELLERLRSLNAEEGFRKDFVERQSQLWITTIHGILYRFINEYGSQVGLLPKASLVSEVNWHRSHRKILRTLLEKNNQFQTHWDLLLESKPWQEWITAFQSYFEVSLIHSDLNSFDFAKISYPESDFLQKSHIAFKFCAEAFNEAVLKEKISTAQISLSDLETLSLYMIQQKPELALQFSELWDYWFIDEFQDTSPIQKELLWKLSHHSKKYIVGDPQQSIYLFRGAEATLFDIVEKEFEEKEFLSLNYRSKPSLLLFFNFVFENLSRQFLPMKPKMGELSKEPVAKWVQCKSSDDEITAALTQCLLLIQSGTDPKDIVILARSNSILVKIEKAAKLQNLSVKVTSDSKFYKLPVVREALVTLYCLLNPYDDLYFSEMLRTSFFQISEKSLFEIQQKKIAQKSSVFVESQSGLSANTDFKLWLEVLESQKNVGSFQAWTEFLKLKMFTEKLNSVDPSGELQTQFLALTQWLESTISQGNRRASEILDSLLILSEVEDLKFSFSPLIESHQIQAMTIHASKGLQFKKVIVVGAGKKLHNSRSDTLLIDDEQNCWLLNLKPQNDSHDIHPAIISAKEKLKSTEALEFDRLAYVALTRAEENVILISSDKKEQSWVHRMGLKTEPGLHVNSQFSYEVCEYDSTVMPQAEKIDELKNETVTKREIPFREMQKPRVNLISPTSIIEGAKKDEKLSINKEVKKNFVSGLEKAAQGTVVHAEMELFKYSKLVFNREPPKPLDFLNSRQWSELSEVLQTGNAEFGFIIDLKKYLKLESSLRLQGQIDLWGYNQNSKTYFIVDYKTGSSVHADKAFYQMEVYAFALMTMGLIPENAEVSLVAIFLSESIYEKRKCLGAEGLHQKMREALKPFNSHSS